MLIHTEHLTGTAVAGTFSVNTAFLRGICHHIVVKPATETTIYNVKIVNSASITIYDRTSETGTLSEFIQIPLRGIYTVTVYSSTVNESYVIQLNIEE
jgi:hypothetical protein